MRIDSKNPSGQPFSVASSMTMRRPSRRIATGPHGNSKPFGSLTAREFPLLNTFVVTEDVYTRKYARASGFSTASKKWV